MRGPTDAQGDNNHRSRKTEKTLNVTPKWRTESNTLAHCKNARSAFNMAIITWAASNSLLAKLTSIQEVAGSILAEEKKNILGVGGEVSIRYL